MICTRCNFNNADGSAFCGSCGAPLIPVQASQIKPLNNDDKKQLIDTDEAMNQDAPVTPGTEKGVSDDSDERTTAIGTIKDESVKDESDESTTVLTSDMLNIKQDKSSAPMNLQTPGDKKASSAPVNSPAPGSQRPPAAPGRPVAPQAGAGMRMGNNQGASAANIHNPKKNKGSRVYVVISAVAMAAMAGIIVFGFIHYSGRLKDIKDEKNDIASSADAAAMDYEAQIASLTSANSALSDSNTTYEAQIEELKSNVTKLETDLGEAQKEAQNYSSQLQTSNESNQAYEAYDNLIEYADGHTAQGDEEFFCSDSVLHMKVGDEPTKVMVYFYPEGELFCKASVGKVVDYKWWESEDEVKDENRLYPLYITPQKEGNTVLTITNSTSDTQLTIYISVEK